MNELTVLPSVRDLPPRSRSGQLAVPTWLNVVSPCRTIEEVLFRLKVPPFVTETVPVGLNTEALKLKELPLTVPPLLRTSSPLLTLNKLELENDGVELNVRMPLLWLREAPLTWVAEATVRPMLLTERERLLEVPVWLLKVRLLTVLVPESVREIFAELLICSFV